MPGLKDETTAGNDLLELLWAACDCMSSERFMLFVVNGKAAVHNNATPGFVLISVAIT